MNVAFVHDWLVTYRGGEKVLENLLDFYPDAPIYTLFVNKNQLTKKLRTRDIRTPIGSSMLKPFRKALLPVLPKLIESFDLKGFDGIISTSSCVAKGAISSKNCPHLCYIHSPMRYVWDQMESYIDSVKHVPFAEYGIRKLAPSLRAWDVRSSERVTRYLANSTFVQKRVKDFYGRDSEVLFPPIELTRFLRINRKKPEYFLGLGAFVPYKRFDLAIEAAQKAKVPLVLAGDGPELSRLQNLADPNWVRIIRKPSDTEWDQLLSQATALLFPGVEDFGLVPVEAMASGVPVIAYRKGGALDTVKEHVTGLFFDSQDSDTLAETLLQFKVHRFDETVLRQAASEFSPEAFCLKVMRHLKELGFEGYKTCKAST